MMPSASMSLANLLALSAQIACVVVAAEAIDTLVRLRAPAIRYGFWRIVWAICLALPWLQTPAPVTPATVTVSTTSAPASAVVSAVPSTPVTEIDWAWWLSAVIVAGIALRLAWITIGYAKLGRLRSAGKQTPARDYEPLQSALGTRADVRYVQTVRQPVTFGLLRPVVLLPEALGQKTQAIRSAVVAHELVHVRRRDWCWQLAEEVVRAAFWFNPAMWWVTSRVQLAREEVVDGAAVRLTGDRREYVEALLAFADEAPFASAPAFARRRHLFRRILLLSTEEVMSTRRIVASAIVLTVAVAFASWSAVRAFPLSSDGSPTSQQWTISELGQPPGPVEQSAKSVGVSNPVPKRTYGGPPVFPEAARGDYASVTVALRTVVDTAGHVAELRLAGFSFRRGGIGATVDAGQNIGQRFEQFASKAEFRDAAGQVISAASMRPMFEEFIHAAATAVQQWQYEPPLDGPIVFTTVIQFMDGKPAAIGTAGTVLARGTNGVLRVGGAIKPPVKIKDVKPVYPPEAMDANVQGVVILELRIEADGQVGEAHVLRSIPMLDDAAVGAALQWEFEPTHLNGVAVPVMMTVTIQFAL